MAAVPAARPSVSQSEIPARYTTTLCRHRLFSQLKSINCQSEQALGQPVGQTLVRRRLAVPSNCARVGPVRPKDRTHSRDGRTSHGAGRDQSTPIKRSTGAKSSLNTIGCNSLISPPSCASLRRRKTTPRLVTAGSSPVGVGRGSPANTNVARLPGSFETHISTVAMLRSRVLKIDSASLGRRRLSTTFIK